MSPTPPPTAARTKPRLRGVSHEIAAFLACPAALALAALARSGSARVGAATYGASLFLLFAVSALYHRPTWSPRAREIMWRVDHSAIFVLIAGTFTPLCLAMRSIIGELLLFTVWLLAAVGVAISIFWVRAPKRLMTAFYLAMGWLAVPVLPALRATIGAGTLSLLLVGGVLYTTGAVIYAARRPDPFPNVFGFHEIFHLFVVAAAACHFVVVGTVVGVLG
jgi:hemolysin III